MNYINGIPEHQLQQQAYLAYLQHLTIQQQQVSDQILLNQITDTTIPLPTSESPEADVFDDDDLSFLND